MTASSTVTVLPVGAGPGQPYDNFAPLVIYGDTSQDGVWYGGDPKHAVAAQLRAEADAARRERARDALPDGSRTAAGYTGTITMETGVSVTGHFFDLSRRQHPASITRTSGTWSATDFAAGKTIDVSGDAGGTFTILTNDATTLTLSPIGLSTLPNLTGASLTVKVLNSWVEHRQLPHRRLRGRPGAGARPADASPASSPRSA